MRDHFGRWLTGVKPQSLPVGTRFWFYAHFPERRRQSLGQSQGFRGFPLLMQQVTKLYKQAARVGLMRQRTFQDITSVIIALTGLQGESQANRGNLPRLA